MKTHEYHSGIERLKEIIVSQINLHLHLYGYPGHFVRVGIEGAEYALSYAKGEATGERLPTLPNKRILLSNDIDEEETPAGVTKKQAAELRKWWKNSFLSGSQAEIFYLPSECAYLFGSIHETGGAERFFSAFRSLEDFASSKNGEQKGFGAKTVRQRAKDLGIVLPRNAASRAGQTAVNSKAIPVSSPSAQPKVVATPNKYDPSQFPIIDQAINATYKETLEYRVKCLLSVPGNVEVLLSIEGGRELVEFTGKQPKSGG
jgi:hypothetical protein